MSDATSSGYQAFGVILSNATGNSSSNTFSPLANLIDITPPTLTVASIDTSNNDSPSLNGRPVEQKLPGWMSVGDVPAKLLYKATQDGTITAIVGVPGYWLVTLPDSLGVAGTKIYFPGFISSKGIPSPLRDKLETDITITVTGKPTIVGAS